MKNRPDRNIEIFSLSAIDLFAAAMGAFALLAIILLPYYQNEVRENTPDNALADLARAAQDSAVESEIKKKALEQKRSAAARNVSDVKSQVQQTDSGPRTRVWPSGGALRNVNSGSRSEAENFAKNLTRQFGGSASMLDAFEKMLAGPGEAIFLVSDGLPNPRVNNGLNPQALARRITQMNGGRKEIHAVVVGNYFDYQGTVEFMETLAAGNNGQFMALASPDKGVCD